MAKDLPSNFEDPALKRAVQRAWGGETAPEPLRNRVAEALVLTTAPSATPTQTIKPKFDWRRSPLIGLAAAAMIIIGFAVSFQHLRPTHAPLAYELPADLAADMVAAHNFAVVDGNLPTLPGVTKGNFDQIRSALKDQLNHPVLVGSLGRDWQLEGAGFAQIGTADAAQLVFSRGDEKLSVFSFTVANRPYSPRDGTDYTQVVDGHPISGVVKGGAVHCIVGSKDSKLRAKDVAKLRDRVKGLIASAQPSPEIRLAQARADRSSSSCNAATRDAANRL